MSSTAFDTAMDNDALARLIEVPVEKLEIGMYVAQLDRPWLETPFLFQGFKIRSEREIRQLAEHCNHVYIDYTRHTAGPRPVRRKAGGLRSLLRNSGIGRLVRRAAHKPESEPVPAERYPETRETEAEIPDAMKSQADAERTVADVIDDLRRGKKLEVEPLIEVVNPMIDSVLRNKDALAALMRIKRKDDYTYSHALANSVWATLFGRHLGLDRNVLEDLALGTLLLDVGKTKLPTDLLQKPAGLEPREFELVRRHVEFGLDIIAESRCVTNGVLAVVESHHERHNGSGYPKGLDGPAIPVLARIAGIVDAYDAMITSRPYAEPVSSYNAMRELSELADELFQAEMVEQFMQAIGMFPTGSIVELNTGEVGIVVAQNTSRRLKPKVMLVLDENKQRRNTPAIIDLMRIEREEPQSSMVWISRGLQPGAYGISAAEFYL